VVSLRHRAPPGVTPVTLLTEIPAPYRIPLFNALARRVALRVLFLRDRHPDRLYDLHHDELEFAWNTVPGIQLTISSRWLVLNRSVAGRLRDADAVILGGWNQPAFWEALAACRLRRVPVILWVESTRTDERSGRHEPVKRHLLRTIDAFLVPGAASREYLVHLGVGPERIAVAPNAVDPHIFGTAVRTRSDGPVRLLAVGRLAREKGIDTLLQAADGLPVEIVLAGTGPEEPTLRRLAGRNVTFLGHVGRDALPEVYANADVLVMPSRSEPWGMALNEAALAGLPLVSTTVAGAARELIEESVNGFRVPPDDPIALRAALSRVIDDEQFRQAAGARSRELVSALTPAAWADSVSRLIDGLARR
jgi:glycosyltransferase involved in cell wall biosynthesis